MLYSIGLRRIFMTYSKRYRKGAILLLILPLIFSSCSHYSSKLAISKGSGSPSYMNYSKWLMNYDDDLHIIDLYGRDYEEALEIVEDCDGLILSGGPDVHPGYFNQPQDTAFCSIDNYRDTLEFAIIEMAKQKNIPILAICRGMQILNVAEGGTLIVDIPSETGSKIHQVEHGDSEHIIEITKGTIIAELAGEKNIMVNSNHHQAVGKLAQNLKAGAIASDGIIEAFEWKEKSAYPFMIAVQWHPERLNYGHSLSGTIALRFLKEVRLKTD